MATEMLNARNTDCEGDEGLLIGNEVDDDLGDGDAQR